MANKKEKSSLFNELQSLVREGLEEALKDLNENELENFFDSNDGDPYDNLEEPLKRIAGTFLDSVNEQATEGYEEDKEDENSFEERLNQTFQPYFIELYGLLSICMEAIGHHRDYAVEQKIFKNKKQQARYFTIIRLHARALRICNEAMSLIKSGYGTAALSRWRALHELATTISYFIENPDAIDLFLEHSKVLSYEAMADYNKYSELLKHVPYTNSEVAGARRTRDNLVKKHSEQIKKPYGWLSVYSNGRLNNFRDMEQESGQEHLRPYYRYASYGIHANVKSLFSGEDYSALENDHILLVGASDGGMEEVAQLVPISIGYATIAILMGISPNAGSIITANTILLKQEQLMDVFASIKLPDEKNTES